jgi:hypothetical protein
MSRLSCRVLAVLSCLSCSSCPFLVVFSWLSSSGHLLLDVKMSWLPFLAVLIRQSGPFLAVRSFPGCPVLSWLSLFLPVKVVRNSVSLGHYRTAINFLAYSGAVRTNNFFLEESLVHANFRRKLFTEW